MMLGYSCNFHLHVFWASVARSCGAFGLSASDLICAAVVLWRDVETVWGSLSILRAFQVRLGGVPGLPTGEL